MIGSKGDKDQAYGKAQTGGMQEQPIFGNSDSAANFLGDLAARVHGVTKNGCLDIVRIAATGAENIRVTYYVMNGRDGHEVGASSRCGA